jgi:hypothetical protein
MIASFAKPASSAQPLPPPPSSSSTLYGGSSGQSYGNISLTGATVTTVRIVGVRFVSSLSPILLSRYLCGFAWCVILNKSQSCTSFVFLFRCAAQTSASAPQGNAELMQRILALESRNRGP